MTRRAYGVNDIDSDQCHIVATLLPHYKINYWFVWNYRTGSVEDIPGKPLPEELPPLVQYFIACLAELRPPAESPPTGRLRITIAVDFRSSQSDKRKNLRLLWNPCDKQWEQIDRDRSPLLKILEGEAYTFDAQPLGVLYQALGILNADATLSFRMESSNESVVSAIQDTGGTAGEGG